MIGLPDIDSELIARAKKKDEEAIADIIHQIDKRCYSIVFQCLNGNKRHLETVTGCVESSAKADAILDAKPLAIVAPASVVIKICLALNIIVFNPFCLLQTFLSPFTNSNEVLFKKLYLFFIFLPLFFIL